MSALLVARLLAVLHGTSLLDLVSPRAMFRRTLVLALARIHHLVHVPGAGFARFGLDALTMVVSMMMRLFSLLVAVMLPLTTTS